MLETVLKQTHFGGDPLGIRSESKGIGWSFSLCFVLYLGDRVVNSKLHELVQTRLFLTVLGPSDPRSPWFVYKDNESIFLIYKLGDRGSPGPKTVQNKRIVINWCELLVFNRSRRYSTKPHENDRVIPLESDWSPRGSPPECIGF